MLKVDLKLSELDDNDFCYAELFVSEDDSDDLLIIPFQGPTERILRLMAVLMKEDMEKAILKNFKKVSEVKEAVEVD